MTDSRLIIVANRLPYQLKRKKGSQRMVPNAGGLVTGIRSYLNTRNNGSGNKAAKAIWIGASDISEKQFAQEYGNDFSLQQDEFILHPVFLSANTKEKYYNGFCNSTIWPLFHYFPSYAKYNSTEYGYYVIANSMFRDAVLRVCRANDIIWVHDYHLMLLPSMLRRQLPDASIGFFLHIPFPSFELYRLIPDKWRREILNGLLGADLIGFHTHDYVQHFMKSITQLMGYDNALRIITTPDRSIMADAFPISIDFDKFHKASQITEVSAEKNKIRKKFSGIQIIFSVDRLDYAKGILNRLEGFELFLEQNLSYHHKVSYILLIVPSRDIIPKYHENKKEIEGLVSRINGRFGTIEWTPVVYQYKSVDFTQLAGLYLAGDIALITPLRDGMNLVAKEFIASRSDKKGVLILSETAGAAAELGEAVIINPYDRQEIANALLNALNMPGEMQEKRSDMMQHRIREYDIMKWAKDFMQELDNIKHKQASLKIKEINRDTELQIEKQYANASKRLIFLDYDGTLTPLVSLPHLAFPGESLRQLLASLAADKKNTVALISGRSKDVLQSWFGNLAIHIVAEHGTFTRDTDNTWSTPGYHNEWQNKILPLMEAFAERCSGSFVERKLSSLAWHFRNSENDLGFLRSRELLNILMEHSLDLGFQVVEGHKVIEARQRGTDKGTAALKWLDAGDYDFMLAIGDDRTDEDLFRELNKAGGITIRVGLTQSIAKYNFRVQKSVIDFLSRLAESPLQQENVY